MRDFVARRIAGVPPSGIRRFFDIAATMDDVVSLGIGEPDFVTPEPILRAGIKSLEQGETHYTSNSGIPELPGDEVIVPTPCFVSYQPEVIFAGGTPVVLKTRVEDDFQVSASDLKALITPKTKALLFGYPNNPTGAVMSRERLQALAEVAKEHDLLVISDEIYDRLVYDHEHVCIASLDGMHDRTITLGGFSKDYAMTGWRIGYAAAPSPILGAMRKIHQYTIMSAPTVSQVAALEALRIGNEHVEMMVAEYNRRRRLIVDGFNELGLKTFEPRGAFYAFPSIEASGMDDEAFAERLLDEERVAVIPGNAFGADGNFVRCSYATSYEKIEEALERMRRFMQRHG